MDIEAERALKAAEYLFDHAKNDLGAYLLDNFEVVKNFITRAALAAPKQSEKCHHCGTGDVELLRLCHNSACAAYGREESIYQGWELAAPPATPVLSDEGMSKLVRYNAVAVQNNGYEWGVEMVSASDGRFVEFDDVRALLAKARP